MGLPATDSQVALHQTYLLNNQVGIEASGNGSLLADSCHFQANGTALRVTGNGFTVQAVHSDFVDCGGPAIVNLGQTPLQAMDCHGSGPRRTWDRCWWSPPACNPSTRRKRPRPCGTSGPAR